MATLPQPSSAVEVLHVYNCNTHKAVELKNGGDQEYWSGLVLNGPGGKPWPSEDLTHRYPGVKNYYRAIVKEPGTGYTFHVYFQDALEEKRLDARRAAMLGGI